MPVTKPLFPFYKSENQSPLDTTSECKSIFDFDETTIGNALDSSDIGDIDYSSHLFPNELWLIKPTWEITVKVIAFLPIVIGGIFGNIAVLNAIRTNRLLRLAPANLFIANMALSDLCSLLTGPWLLMCIDSFQSYVLGGFICKTEGFVQSTLLLSSVLSLTAISCDRLVAIVFPRKKRLGPRATWVVVASIWILAITTAAPLIVYRHYDERQWCNFLECYCTEIKNTDVIALYWIIIVGLLVWFPLGVMLLSYSAIFCKLQNYTLQARNNSINTATDFRSRVARMVLVLLLVFIVCRVPFTSLIYIRNSTMGSSLQLSEGFLTLWFISHYLIYTNAAINPVIYGMTNEGFRGAFHGRWPCLICIGDRSSKVTTKANNNPVAGVTPLTVRALQPREPYHLEPCWRPNNNTSTASEADMPAYTIKTTDK